MVLFVLYRLRTALSIARQPVRLQIWISIGILLVCKKIFTTVSGINRLKRLLKDPYIALGFKLGLDKNDTATSEKYMAYTLLLNIAMAGVLLYWALKGMPHLFIFK